MVVRWVHVRRIVLGRTTGRWLATGLQLMLVTVCLEYAMYRSTGVAIYGYTDAIVCTPVYLRSQSTNVRESRYINVSLHEYTFRA